jgi:hypothetical protein
VVEAEGDIVVEVDDEGEEEEEEEEEINPRSSEEPSSIHRSPAVHPTRFRALANLFPAATHSHSVTWPRGQHVIHMFASLRLLAHCDTTKQEHLNSQIVRDA